jgi:hypothetical protein
MACDTGIILRDEFHGEWNYEIRPNTDVNVNVIM